MNYRAFIFCTLAWSITCAGCAVGPYARTGTVGGGLAGAGIGALAGLESDRPLEGAAIGAVAGSIIGNATGGMVDRDVNYANAQDQAYVQQARSQAVTANQVIQMTQSGVGDQLIINQMQTNGVLAPLTTDDMISLKRYGVNDNVISAWQRSQVAGTRARVARVRPIIVDRFVEPAYGHCRGYNHCPYDWW